MSKDNIVLTTVKNKAISWFSSPTFISCCIIILLFIITWFIIGGIISGKIKCFGERVEKKVQDSQDAIILDNNGYVPL